MASTLTNLLVHVVFSTIGRIPIIFCREKFFWQNGYGGFSVSASQIGKVRRYIGNQSGHHKSNTFKEELIEILDKYHVDYNVDDLWD